MSKSGDKKNYADSMVKHTFDQLYNKETNEVKTKSDGHGLGMVATSMVDDDTDERVITMTIRIKKDN